MIMESLLGSAWSMADGMIRPRPPSSSMRLVHLTPEPETPPEAEFVSGRTNSQPLNPPGQLTTVTRSHGETNRRQCPRFRAALQRAALWALAVAPQWVLPSKTQHR
jgi:hypothetical protein